jgi:hypothetical protein
MRAVKCANCIVDDSVRGLLDGSNISATGHPLAGVLGRMATKCLEFSTIAKERR